MPRSKFPPLIISLLFAWSGSAGAIDFQSQVRPILEEHCLKCHGGKKQKGDLRLDTLSSNFLDDRPAAETWHDVKDALNLGEMPPEDEPPLSREDRQILVGWITQEIEALIEARKSTGGRVVLRRLNRTEYRNTMQDLLGLDFDFSKNLPPESLSDDGFRNDGSTLQMSDLQLEYYLEAARLGLGKVITDSPEPTVIRKQFTKTIQDKNRGSNILDEDQQFVAKLIDYPAKGEILIRARARARLAEGRGYPQLRAAIGYRADVHAPRGFIEPVDVTSEDWQTFEFRGRIEDFPFPSKTQSKFPGLLIWLDNAYAEGFEKPLKARGKGKKQNLKKGPLTYPVIEIESMEVIGPVFESWPPRLHTNILPASELSIEDPAYLNFVLQRFMTRAFRRPVAEAETQPYLQLFQKVRPTTVTFEEAIKETLAMVLISPDFLYLLEPADDSKRPLTDWELASRLSYFLWSTMPDEGLLELAENGTLTRPGILSGQVRRMITDKRSWQFVEQFTDQWLDVGAVQRVAINPDYYPGFDDSLKESMRGETLHFFGELLSRNLSALNILDSDFTMLDEPLAKHYGLAGPRGRSFERVTLNPGDKRGGILAHGSMLLGNSTGEDSHPVKRAVWIRARLLDDPPNDPPPNTPSLDSNNPDFAKLTVREQLAAHRKEESCNDCHRGIDPWGITLENFGGDGLWRTQILRTPPKGKDKDQKKLPVLTESTLPDGTEVNGFTDLKTYLVQKKPEQFARAFTSRLLTYALGRRLELVDEKTVDTLTEKFIASDYRIESLIHLVVADKTFQTK